MNNLPDELILGIFSYLNLAALGTVCSVSKEWKRLANDPFLKKDAIYREVSVFDNDKWIKYFGKDILKEEDRKEAIFSLPLNIFKDFERFKEIFPEKNAKDNLMLVRLPKSLNGGLTLKNLEELAKIYFSNSHAGYRFISPSIVEDLGDKSIDKSYWVLMTKDLLPGSRSKSYGEQQKIIARLAEKSLAGYEVPGTLEAALSILSHYFISNIRLFSDKPLTYTRCKEDIRGFQIAVGGMCISSSNLNVVIDGYDYDCYGVAALRRF
jgi:hypothetical protein